MLPSTLDRAITGVAHFASRTRASLAASRLAALALAALVASCASTPEFAPACPELGLLPGATDITRFRPGGQDVTDMVLDGRITAVPADCGAGGKGITRARLHVTAQLTRGPAADGRTAVVPYIVAVMEGPRVLDEQDYALGAVFAANTDRIAINGEDITLNIPVTPEKSAAAYKIWVGFKLSPEELAYNRRRGPR